MSNIVRFPNNRGREREGGRADVPQERPQVGKEGILIEFGEKEKPFHHGQMVIPDRSAFYDTSRILMNEFSVDEFFTTIEKVGVTSMTESFTTDIETELLLARAAFLDARISVDERGAWYHELFRYTKEVSDKKALPALREEARIVESVIEGMSKAEREGEEDLYFGISFSHPSSLYDEEQMHFMGESVHTVLDRTREIPYETDELRQKAMETLQIRMLRARESYIIHNSLESAHPDALRELIEFTRGVALELKMPHLAQEVQKMLKDLVGSTRAGLILERLTTIDDIHRQEAIKQELEQLRIRTGEPSREEGEEEISVSPKDLPPKDPKAKFRVIK